MNTIIKEANFEELIFKEWIEAKRLLRLNKRTVEDQQINVHVLGLLTNFMKGTYIETNKYAIEKTESSRMKAQAYENIGNTAFIYSGYFYDSIEKYDRSKISWNRDKHSHEHSRLLEVAAQNYSNASYLGTKKFLSTISNAIEDYAKALQHMYVNLGIGPTLILPKF